jgi:hypothetical protein
MCVVIAMANARPVKKKRISKFLLLLLMLALAGGSYFIWKELQSGGLPAGFASGNGRIEATEVDMATKQEGRVEAVLCLFLMINQNRTGSPMQDMRCFIQIEQACEQSRMMRAHYNQVDVLISGQGRNFFRWVSDEEN